MVAHLDDAAAVLKAASDLRIEVAGHTDDVGAPEANMTLSLARALAPAIRVNAICPGYIDTPWFTKGRGAEAAKLVRDAVTAGVPLQIASSPEDIAELVCFLASPRSRSMTGELVRMDAGMHLGEFKAVTRKPQ